MFGLAQTIERVAIDPDPYRPFEPVPEGQEYRVAMPLMGPWYQGWYQWPFGPSPHLGPESFYNPRTYPYPALNPFLPQWTGSFIQPGNIDTVAGELMMSGMNQGWPDWYIEDPMGVAYWESIGPLGPGESIAVASQWAADLHPRGFSAVAMHL